MKFESSIKLYINDGRENVLPANIGPCALHILFLVYCPYWESEHEDFLALHCDVPTLGESANYNPDHDKVGHL